MTISTSPTKINAFLNCKCPKCRKGDIFTNPIFSTKFYESNKNCPKCNQLIEKETGYYWASMYISYSFSAGVALFISLIAINNNLSFNYIIAIVLSVILLLSPISLRYSRMILIYGISNIKFDKEISNKL